MSDPKISNILDELKDKHPQAGMTVPDGYFDSFNEKIISMLPEQDWEREANNTPVVLKRSRWQKIRPYAYLAAMFIGIWCMMQMFDLVRSNTTSNFDTNPALLSAIDNDAFYYDYGATEFDDQDIYDDLYDQGIDATDTNLINSDK